MRATLNVLVACLLAVFAIGPAVAQSPCAPPGYRIDVRPDPSGPATVVSLGMRVVDLLEINDVNQTISVDIAFRMSWTDDRLAGWEGCKLSVNDIWFPNLIMKNSGRMFERWPSNVSVGKGGQVTYMQRVSGTFASYHTLASFPFDTQIIKLQFYPLDWSIGKLVFQVDESFTGISTLLNISDWQINGVEAVLTEGDIDAFDQTRAGFELDISAQRHLSFYVWKILFPIALIVIMSWSVFWIDPAQFGTQIGLSATSVLTMVAFIFATTNMLPRLGYFTLLDRYIAWATVFVFAALLVSLITGYLCSRNQAVLAHRVDLVSRFAFPVLFALFCVKFLFDAV